MLSKYLGGLIRATRNKPASNVGGVPGDGIFSKEFAAQLRNQTKWPTPGVVAAGQVEYTTPGSYSWIAPSGVSSVCVVCVGGGGGGHGGYYTTTGSGGGLGWKNNIPVTPGQAYSVVVGHGGSGGINTDPWGSTTAGSGGASYFINTSTVAGGGGSTVSESQANYTGDGGGYGGRCHSSGLGYHRGGAGAAGYTGKGGDIGASSSSYPPWWTGVDYDGNAGQGGGAGAGSFSGNHVGAPGGGGVGILGQGSNGAGGQGTSTLSGGRGGSGGQNGLNMYQSGYNDNLGKPGGSYGGGGGGGYYNSADATYRGAAGAGGAVRIIWGAGRSFPSTNTGNV